MDISETSKNTMKRSIRTTYKQIKRHWRYYILLILPIAYIIVFNYVPMAGIVVAFKKYNISKGIWGSQWVGLKYYKLFFTHPNFWTLIKNTLTVSLYQLISGSPLPIILAILVNEVRNKRFKKTVQTVTYAPFFISTVVMVSIIMQILDPNIGVINIARNAMGLEAINFMGEPAMIKSIYVWSILWQFTGYNAILYIAALSSIDPVLHEAAKVDGANRLQKILHIDLPGITPTIIIVMILNVGRIMSVGFERMYLMQNNMNLSSSEIISTFVYKIGLLNAQFSLSTAIGTFNSVVNLILILTVNHLARRYSETSLW